jgi:hypothetical protein
MTMMIERTAVANSSFERTAVANSSFFILHSSFKKNGKI